MRAYFACFGDPFVFLWLESVLARCMESLLFSWLAFDLRKVSCAHVNKGQLRFIYLPPPLCTTTTTIPFITMVEVRLWFFIIVYTYINTCSFVIAKRRSRENRKGLTEFSLLCLCILETSGRYLSAIYHIWRIYRIHFKSFTQARKQICLSQAKSKFVWGHT